MNSTNKANGKSEIHALFEQQLEVTAQKLQEQVDVYFPTSFDPSVDSYYLPRAHKYMLREDFEFRPLLGRESIEKALTELWQERSSEELIPLAAPTAAVAESLKAVETQDDEVSPFLYVMF